MHRRRFIAAGGAIGAGLLAGCFGDDDELVDDTVTEGTRYGLDLDEGVTLVIDLTNEEGMGVSVTLRDPDEEVVLNESTETADTYEYEADTEGEHGLVATPDERAGIQVVVD